MSVGIIDYGMGNIGSLSNAVYSQGWDPILISSPETFTDISHLIIPGVGSYSSAMQTLADRKLCDLIIEFVKQGKPILGICLGMQLLSDSGSEGGNSLGFGFIPGNVLPLKKITFGAFLARFLGAFLIPNTCSILQPLRNRCRAFW